MTLADRIRDNKAVYTMAGAGDLAVEKLREVPEQVTRLQGDFRENLTKLQVEVRDNVTRLQGRVEVKDLPGAAVAYVNQVSTRTVEVIDELAERGKKIVTRVENQVATQELQQSAQRTQRRTKAAVGEAKKTARAASRAATDASKKIGD
ncbi:hypothetical protein [Thermomonospora umbrina]|uniref:Uncharacterized protein n=1 Tax=Thermomonospora umbrina TaxID=111806 RepID=A0A3D9SY13_9ACTN|nr:hypothetical protein [Thermomonospora umbrina]REE96501.1 hypothetical protein DFJ69_1938 [Thermomonospora umbrina]